MLGRATRRCDAIGKEAFKIFDAVGVYETLEDFTSMKPVSPSQTTSFVQLVDEVALIDSNERAQKQLDQIIAKFQRKKKYITPENSDAFEYNANGLGADDFIQFLKGISQDSIESELKNYKGVWTFLDELKPEPSFQYFSDHKDEYLRTERGYGNGQKPEDYLEGLKRYIEENANKIVALQIICSRPKDLDRKSLKELKILLDQAGFTTRSLNAAWKESKNQDMAADIISFIRTLAIGSTLISHEERIQNAIKKVKSLKDWNKIQLKWIERFEKQLLQEDVIKPEDLDLNPFDEAGGFQRLDKIFEHQLQFVLDTMNEHLYTA
jgi:type I restriction enzyme R subunit